MAHRSRMFHQVWAHLGKVANVTLVNPRNQQKWLYQDLVMQIYSPWCTTWCSVIIWGFEHVHKNSAQKDTLVNVELFKFGSGQKGFWGTLIKITFSPTCSIWSRADYYTIWACAPSLRAFGHVWQCKNVQTWKRTEVVLRGFHGVILFSMTWYLARSSKMSYVTC